MVEEALTLAPANRCPIDVLAVSPLFWSPGDVLSFYTVRPVVFCVSILGWLWIVRLGFKEVPVSLLFYHVEKTLKLRKK